MLEVISNQGSHSEISHFTPTRMDIIKNTDNNKSWWRHGEIRSLRHYWWECKWCSCFGKESWQFLKSLSTELTMCVCACMCYWLLSHVRLFATPWTVAHQAPLSMGFPDKNTREGCHFLLQGIFLTQGLNLRLLQLLHSRQIFLPAGSSGKFISVLLFFLFLPGNKKIWIFFLPGSKKMHFYFLFISSIFIGVYSWFTMLC